MSERVRVTIDGVTHEVEEGTLLIQAAQDTGTYIPRFCWHRRMSSVGMCRMCLVEVQGPRGPTLTTSCTIPVADGMVVDTRSPTVKKAQEGVLEFLLINHPLDCPVCDRGGECPLQDQTLSHGPGESRFVEEKRHFEKPIPISDLVLLDRERCILCDRCTRFADEIAGDPLIHFIDRGSYTQVNTFPDHPFASYFSGNTVQLCPVGALTAVPYRFRARPWDLEAVESTCVQCSVGCRVSVQASHNEVVRMLGVDVDATNQGWLCDKGRFAYEYLRAPERLASPLVRNEAGELEEASWADALDAAADALRRVIDDHGPTAVAGIGGARSTNEEAYAFGRLLRAVVGTGNVDASVGDGLDPVLLAGTERRGAIDDLERAATVLVWAPDLKEELPVLYLRVRRAATRLGATLVVVHPRDNGLDHCADHVVRYRPGEGQDLLARLRGDDPDLDDVRAALAEGPVVCIVGRPGLAEPAGLASDVAAYAAGLPEASVLPVTRRGNVYGAVDMGLAPGLLPGRIQVNDEAARAAFEEAWDRGVPEAGLDADGILAGLTDGTVHALVLLGADPAADHPWGERAREAVEAAEVVVSLDLFVTASNRGAAVILPVDGFSEVEGTVTNLEGRVQKVNRLVPGVGAGRPAVEVIEDLAARLGGSVGGSAAAVAEEIRSLVPGYGDVSWDALAWGPGRDGIVVGEPPASGLQPPAGGEPPASGLSAAGEGMRLHLARVLYDRGTMVTAGPSLAKLARSAAAHLHPDDAARLGVAEGGTVVVGGDGGSAELPVALDPSLDPGVVYVPFNTGAVLGSSVAVTVESR
jgi:NADH-quinone oxidoreductase subunit G